MLASGTILFRSEANAMHDLSRRELMAGATAAGAAMLVSAPRSGAALATEGEVPLHLLEPHAFPGAGVTFGLPWAKGTTAKDVGFTLSADGAALPLQSWPLAYWPDGSLKWTAHATVLPAGNAKAFALAKGGGAQGRSGPTVTVADGPEIVVDTGAVRASIPRSGTQVFSSLAVNGTDVARGGRLVLVLQDKPHPDDEGAVARTTFAGTIGKATVEQQGPVRTVVKLEGTHVAGDRRALPFVVRLYFYAGSPAVRLVHTFTYDLDDQRDFIAGLGVRFDVPMRDAPHDRHVRFVGKDDGVFAEAVRGLTGLRRDPGPDARAAQWEGTKVPAPETWPGTSGRSAAERVQYIPAWGDYSLRQLSADGFDIRKRTRAGHAWIPAAADTRASGTAYLGGASGGVAFGMRDFWQRHPTALDLRNAHADLASATVWFYSPDAPAMDVRFYHDGMGQDTHQKQYQGGLEITYEDYEPGYGTAVGISRTSEVHLMPVAATPSRESLAAFAKVVTAPPQLVSTPETYASAGTFGGLWKPIEADTPAKKKIEYHLDFLVNYYLRETEQRHWYGFWDFGDFMHTYDEDRHCWRYDVGGFAWDNSELSPDLFLWYSFLRTGRADLFRFAEAQVKHTSDVDSYHAGPYRLLGTRHGVQHWGDSAKQLRISTAIYRRFYYYLTADDRIGDHLRALREADATFMTTDPIRKVRKDGDTYRPEPNALSVGFGTDWGSIAIAFLTEYERTLDEEIKAKLLNSMRSIGGMPHGFFSGGGRYDLATGAFTKNDDNVSISHLSAAFGLPEVCAELIQNFDVPEFTKAWLDYAQHYNTPAAERAKILGFNQRNQILVDGHSRATAFAAVMRRDDALARRAWHELLSDNVNPNAPIRWPDTPLREVRPPQVLKAIQESRLSTNSVAQWATAAIENLALIPHALPEDL